MHPLVGWLPWRGGPADRGSDRPPSTQNLYVKPNGPQLAELAQNMRDGLRFVDIQAVGVADGPRVFDIVASGHCAGRKYVLQP